ncbi:transposase [Streptomyces sp. NPDC059863]|uniref:transposase n=1 Tax=unclassified Streptomyces TaxID=2593676 RepID=UPI0036647FB0
MLPESLRSRKRLNDRTVLNGIVWKFRTGTAWRDVPERYGPWATPHTHFCRWAMHGTFGRMLRASHASASFGSPTRCCRCRASRRTHRSSPSPGTSAQLSGTGPR